MYSYAFYIAAVYSSLMYVFNIVFLTGIVEFGGPDEVLDVQVVFIESVVSFYVQRVQKGFSVGQIKPCLLHSVLFSLSLSLSFFVHTHTCLLYTSPSPRDATLSRMPSSA